MISRYDATGEAANSVFQFTKWLRNGYRPVGTTIERRNHRGELRLFS
jgi:hypothetical protein